MRVAMPNAFLLVPGYGAQGATAGDLKDYFDRDGLGAIINSSRGIICAYRKDEYAKYGAANFGEASRAATLDMIADLKKVI